MTSKKSKVNNYLIYILVFVCVASLLIYISETRNLFPNYFFEPLQNYDASFLDYRDFSQRLKTDIDGDDIIDYKESEFYRTDYFNQLNIPYYADKEIENDIKYFNNTSHVLYDFQKNNILKVTKEVLNNQQ